MHGWTHRFLEGCGVKSKHRLIEKVCPSMRLFDEFRSHLQYKIIIPFLLLTLLVALAGAGVPFLFITGTVQERLDNQLVQVSRATSDGVVSQEKANLAFLREIAFAGPNPHIGAPAVADGLASGD